MLQRFAVPIAIVIELAYVLLSRTWLRVSFHGIDYELLLTAMRLASVVLNWLLFRHTLLRAALAPPRAGFSGRAGVALGAGLASVLLVPLLFNAGYPADAAYRWVFAGTSIVVGIREEMVYRGVLQQLLRQRYGVAGALLLSNLVFVLYHFGAQPFNLVGLVELSAMALLLGLLYEATGSLVAPMLVHVLYDALWSLGPLLAAVPQDGWRIALHLAGLALVAYWARNR
jgi:membrane protease YdiL (CAAX protease family)